MKQLTESAIFAVEASVDLRTMVAASSDGVLHTFDSQQQHHVPLHEDAIRSLVLAGSWVLTSSKDGTVKAHDLVTGSTTVLWVWRDYGYGMALSPSRKRVALVSGGGELCVLNLPRPLGEMTPQEMERVARSM